jgi:hypothetical protein
MKYPVIAAGEPPWLCTQELAVPVTIDGTVINAVPSLDAITGDVDLGFGFEATAPYMYVRLADVAGLGDLHGKPVIIDGVSYVVRTVRPKENIDMARLILDKRA